MWVGDCIPVQYAQAFTLKKYIEDIQFNNFNLKYLNPEIKHSSQVQLFGSKSLLSGRLVVFGGMFFYSVAEKHNTILWRCRIR